MIKKLFIRLNGLYGFGGLRLAFAVVQDVIGHSKNRQKIIRDIIAECITGGDARLIEKKAASYFSMRTGRTINYSEPKTFDEKIRWMMLYDSTPLKTRLADKYLVRGFVEERIGERYLVPLMGVWDRFDEINFEMLPEKFVLKCNHGSGMNIVVKDKKLMDYGRVKAQFETWLKENFAYRSFEMHYKDIAPKIIAEKYIEEMDGNLRDYKIHCFNGEPRYIQIIWERNPEEYTAKELFYDFDANPLEWTFGIWAKYEKGISRLHKLDILYELSKCLAEGFDYVRVDFYIVCEEVLFGEMTFTPGAGLHKYNKDFTERVDEMLGDLIRISNRNGK